MKKRVLSLVLALVMLLGLLPTAAFAGAREDGAAMAAVEEGALLNDALSQPGEELPELPELFPLPPQATRASAMTAARTSARIFFIFMVSSSCIFCRVRSRNKIRHFAHLLRHS